MSLSFLWDYRYSIGFYILIVGLLYIFRKKFDKEGQFVFLLRTKHGLALIDRISKRFSELIKFLGYSCVGFAVAGFFLIFYLIFNLAYKMVVNSPGATGASPVLPGFPIAGTGLSLPLISGWIALLVIMVVHEFSHGVVARAFSIPLKNAGIAFFGPIPGAFVEPDEKKLGKAPDIVQYSVFSAGPVSNILLALIMILLMGYVLAPTHNMITTPEGIKVNAQSGYPAAEAGIQNGSVITAVDGVTTLDLDSFNKQLKSVKPGDKVTLSIEKKDYVLTLAENPLDSRQGYMGVLIIEQVRVPQNQLFKITDAVIQWLNSLFFWIYFLSLNIGLINLLPIFITDGARIMKLALEKLISDKKKSWAVFKSINIVALGMLLMLVFLPIIRGIFSLLVKNIL